MAHSRTFAAERLVKWIQNANCSGGSLKNEMWSISLICLLPKRYVLRNSFILETALWPQQQTKRMSKVSKYNESAQRTKTQNISKSKDGTGHSSGNQRGTLSLSKHIDTLSLFLFLSDFRLKKQTESQWTLRIDRNYHHHIPFPLHSLMRNRNSDVLE